MDRLTNIDKAAILHIPLSQYAFAVSEYSLIIRLRAKRDDLTKCILYYGDRVDRENPLRFKEADMQICAKDEEYDYYEAQIEEASRRICYYFKLEKEDEWSFYYGDRFTKELPELIIDGVMVDTRSEYYQYPFILREEIQDVPLWFKEAVVYNIFPDSFANGKEELTEAKRELRLEDGIICRSRLGGTIRGIIENLDYIQDMGFTCLYLNPIFVAGEYHKYDILDYYHIDPCLGTEEDFTELVDKLHKRGMKIIIDGVFNHCSWQFFAFEDVVTKGENSRYCKWFYDLKHPVQRPQSEDDLPDYTCFAYERKMPKFNTSDREVQMYFADVGAYWIEKYHVDGWRLDVANEIDRNFWRKFRAAVKKANPEAVLIGEVWENAHSWLRGDAFDSTMNYEFRRICREYLTADNPDAIRTAYQFERMRMRYPANIAKGQLNLLDTHDVPRFLSLCSENIDVWKLGCILLFMMPGVPSLFYGDEKLISGVTENEYRQPMKWKSGTGQRSFIKSLIHIKKTYINSNSHFQMEWSMINHGLLAFSMQGENGKLLIVLNAKDEEQSLGSVNGYCLLSEGVESNYIAAKGYAIYKTD